MKTVRMANFTASGTRSPFYLIVSTMDPHRDGKTTIDSEDIIKAIFAMTSKCLFFHV